ASIDSPGKGPETEKSWNVDTRALSEVEGYDLSVKNPNTPEEAPLRSPEEILTEMETLDSETKLILNKIKELI
ncbi:MAG: SAM-dependent DNA methyltransferase, partial [Candidatus Marinimicrobia bacterium]|nr:SAM-dependent DNA methyltransferase [Candidatus Neomarinimicrobiota bacterium]